MFQFLELGVVERLSCPQIFDKLNGAKIATNGAQGWKVGFFK